MVMADHTFYQPPDIIDPRGEREIVVGLGSNVSLACSARGHPLLQFTWFQDEKNITTLPSTTTKLLEERRYEIAEGIHYLGNQNVTTSTLYLYNLKLTDTSLFLCSVENGSGFATANFSLTVSEDSPPTSFNEIQNPTSGNPILDALGLSQNEAQLAIIGVGFLILLLLVILIIYIFKNIFLSNRSSKSSLSGDSVTKKPARSSGRSNLSISGPVGNLKSINNDSRFTLDDTGQASDSSDDRHSSGSASSCRKVDPKVLATGELDGFIEHLRTGIINMDYHSMSPVIQFNNTLKKSCSRDNSNSTINVTANGQPMHHFASASNASSIPYYSSNGNGTASMTTTSSDLSPGSGTSVVGSGYNQPTINTYSANAAQMTNCDLQTHLLTNFPAPATNTTTTSYTSDYQSGYSEDHNSIMPPVYYDGSRVANEPPLQIPATMYNSGPIMLAPPIQQQRQQQLQQLQHQQHQQHNNTSPLTLLVKLRNQQNMIQANQRSRYNPGFDIL